MTVFSSARRKTNLPLPQKVQQSGGDDVHSSRSTRSAGGATDFSSAATDVFSSRNASAAAPDRVGVSTASYAAASPCGDAAITEAVLTGPRPHIFAAVTSSEPKAHGGEFLRRNLARELQAHIGAAHGDVLAAFRATLAQLDVKFRALHLYGRHVLDGTHVAVAYLDLAAATLHLASSGGCRVVVTTRDALGRSEVAVELGRPSPEDTAAAQDAAEAAATDRLRGQRQQRREQQRQQAPKKGAAQQSSDSRLGDNMLSMPLHGDVESIVLGSTGFWHEMPVEQAALRVSTGARSAPHAMGGNPAALLTQAALQNVAQRVSSSADPRMAVLRDPATLQQLWKGSQRNYRWGGRQPLRRRRGDVHGDLSAVVIRLDWAGTDTLPRSAFACKRQACANAAVPRSASGASIASAASFATLHAAGRASHWDAVRAHFLHFRPAASAAARSRWYTAVDAALASASKLRAEAAAAAAAAAAPPQPAPAGVEAAVAQQQAQALQRVPLAPAPLAAAKPADAGIAISAVAVPAVSPLRTTSYRRLATGGAQAVPLAAGASLSSFRGLPMQQLSVH